MLFCAKNRGGGVVKQYVSSDDNDGGMQHYDVRVYS